MIDPVIAARLVQQAYDPAFLASRAVPDLSSLGFVFTDAIWGSEGAFSVPYGFLATNPGGAQVIALRGTSSIGEWIEDGVLHMETNPWGPGLVHHGFLGLCRSLGIGQARDPILGKIVSLAGLAVVGHSLGAAVGRLLTMQLGHVGEIQTWGEPRSCNGDAAGYALSCATASRRARNPRDLVPLVPIFDPCRPLDGYRHAGDPVKLQAIGGDPIEAHAIETYIGLERIAAGQS